MTKKYIKKRVFFVVYGCRTILILIIAIMSKFPYCEIPVQID